MNKAYLVTYTIYPCEDGEEKDTHILGVFSSYERAEKLKEKILQWRKAVVDIHEIELDMYIGSENYFDWEKGGV